jgi:hypothetical protein
MKLYACALALLLSAACSGPETPVEALPPQAAMAAPTFKIGVLVDASSPAAASFTAAARLAESQLNQALQQSSAKYQLAVIVAPYGPGQEQDVAIDLINNQGVLGIVSDGSFVTAQVNRLNYELVPRVAHKFPVTCYQCSSPRINDFSDTDLGNSDIEGWLIRTYLNGAFEPAAQVQQVLSRPDGGDLDHDGYLKIVVYFDVDHFSQAFSVQAALDSLHAGAHAVEPVFKILPSSPATRAEEMTAIFDAAPDGHAPDAVFFYFREPNIVEAVGDYSAFAASPKPIATASDEVRRNYLLPALLAAGGEGLEGTSVLDVSDAPSGALFAGAFAGTGQPREMTTSFLYDAVVSQALAIGWANTFGSTDPAVVLGNFPNVSDPTGVLIRPQVSDFKLAVRRMKRELPINYDGAGSPFDFTYAIDEIYPDLVRWKIQGGQFVQLERYRCDPENPTCVRR